MNTYPLEIKRFIKKYFKIVIIGAVTIAVLLTMASFFMSNDIQEEVEPEVEESPIIFGNDSRIAYFRFYIEQPDGSTFNNSSTVHQLFNLNTVRDEVFETTGINVKRIEKEVREEGVHIDFSPVRVTVDPNSSIFTALFETGKNRNNLNVADFYFDKLINKEFNVLEKKIIYPIVEPQLVEEPEIEIKEGIDASETVNKAIIVDLVINTVIWFILGGVLAIGLALLKELYGKKLNFAFGYDNGEEDDLIVFDRILNNQDLINHFIASPFKNKKLIISERPIGDYIKNKIICNKNILTFDGKDSDNKVYLDEKASILEMDVHSKYEEVILLVETNVTSRKWYNEQLKLSELHALDVKTVQINS